MKKEKKVFKKWGKDITPDHAWDMGEMMGARNVFKFLAEDDAIDRDYIAYLLEEQYDRYNKNKEL
jgi:hypothetical protein